jgi:threonine/homoserine/homoserine lactone efflux protein
MLGTHDLALFILSGLLLNLTPGADSLFIATRSARGGLRSGTAAALGVSAGCLVHVLLAGLGLSAILATSTQAFQAVTLVGAAYLVWMGVQMWRGATAPQASPQTLEPSGPGAPRGPGGAGVTGVFVQGLLTNVLNPKVALFFLAFMPQFIDADAPSPSLAFLFLGLIFTVNGALWCLVLAALSARAGARGIGEGTARLLSRVCGAAFVALGLRMASTALD